MEQLTYEEYKKWLDIKTSLEEAGKTSSPIYEEAIKRLIRRPVPPYPKADARITKDDIV